jgi:probable rRNA maturation factor
MNAPQESIEVDISDTQDHLRVDRDAVAALARRTLEAEGVKHASVSIALVDDRASHAINRQHLGHDWPTDVISFRFSEPHEAILTGELIVSAERAAAVARAEGLDPWAELALYVVHGLLHLCGFDDQTTDDMHAMRARESEILALGDIPNAFAPQQEVARWPG